MVAAAIGMVTILVAGRVMVDQLEASRKIETLERQRSNWMQVNRFITHEINLADEVVETPTIEEKSACEIETGTVKMVIRFPRHLLLNSSIYYTTSSEPGWVDNVLKRCGPSIDSSGEYDSAIVSNNVLLDALKIDEDDGFVVQFSGNKKADFQIKLVGKLNSAYQQLEGARARVQDVFIRPNEGNICPQSTAITLTSGNDVFNSDENDDWEDLTAGNVVICGNGGDDELHGADGDDIIEAIAPGSSTLVGGDGNDRLLGANQDDELSGGNDDDILIGKQGNDTLTGGSGTNHYVPGLDEEAGLCDRDEVIGTNEDGYDIIYFNRVFADYTLSNPCGSDLCRVTRTSEGDRKVVSIFGGNLLVFKDLQKELVSEEPSELAVLDPASCEININQDVGLQPINDDMAELRNRIISVIATTIVEMTEGGNTISRRQFNQFLTNVNASLEAILPEGDYCMGSGMFRFRGDIAKLSVSKGCDVLRGGVYQLNLNPVTGGRSLDRIIRGSNYPEEHVGIETFDADGNVMETGVHLR